MKTTELTGAALDWAAEWAETGVCQEPDDFVMRTADESRSTNWAQGGPIIEREGLGIMQHNNIPERPENRWCCVKYVGGMLLNKPPLQMYGSTPLIAAMRCYVASKLGDEVEIPEELNV
jgi:hypothetical protein